MKTIKTSQISRTLVDYDLFICNTSFESRCLEIGSKLDFSKFKKTIICHFEENYIEAENNLEQFKLLFKEKLSVILLSKNNPLLNFDKLFDEISIDYYKNVLIDISTFTREMLLIILKLYSLYPFSEIKITLCYNPSDKYSTIPTDKIEDLWLSKGVQSIRSVLGYSGEFSPIKELMLIVLVGFEAERSQIIIDSFEPHKLFIGKSPSETSRNKELATINNYNFERLVRMNPSADTFEFSCIDIKDTVSILSNIITQNSEKFNIVICPMSNKISTLATASVVFKHPEVQICYSLTNQYNIEAYSTPSDTVLLIEANSL